MELLNKSTELVRLLTEVIAVTRHRNRYLNQIAVGELRLMPHEAENLTRINRVINRQLEDLTKSTPYVRRVVEIETDLQWGSVPDSFQVAYRHLFERAYGTRSLKLGDDPELGKAQAKRSDQKDGARGGAKPSKKSQTSHTRHTILDRKAWEYKRTLDRRLRALAQDIKLFLEGAQFTRATIMCESCYLIGEANWRFCPHCGGAMSDGALLQRNSQSGK